MHPPSTGITMEISTSSKWNHRRKPLRTADLLSSPSTLISSMCKETAPQSCRHRTSEEKTLAALRWRPAWWVCWQRLDFTEIQTITGCYFLSCMNKDCKRQQTLMGGEWEELPSRESLTTVRTPTLFLCPTHTPTAALPLTPTPPLTSRTSSSPVTPRWCH